MTYSKINPTISSIMVIGDGVSTVDSVIVLVLEIKITMLYGKISSTLVVVDNNGTLSLEYNKMN